MSAIDTGDVSASNKRQREQEGYDSDDSDDSIAMEIRSMKAVEKIQQKRMCKLNELLVPIYGIGLISTRGLQEEGGSSASESKTELPERLCTDFDNNLENVSQDVKYAEELQIQEAIMASTSSSKMITSSMTIQATAVVPEQKPTETTAEASASSPRVCEICVESKESDQMFKTETCVHSFCSDCISKHVAAKIQDNIITVTCPGLNCKSVLELDTCRPVLPKAVLELWEEALCKEMIDASQEFYCPFKDCSVLLVNENEGEVIRESECPFCHRLFCAYCKAPWHSGIECEEYQKLNEDERGREDLMVRELAKENRWSRCPHCKFFVERTEGCPHITCRCRFQFCYGCGSEWSDTHAGCRRL